MAIHVFGIRHHGPGCARSLHAALAALRPDAILLEGPADAQSVIPLAAHPSLRPPVALLIHPEQMPQRAVYYPLAEFSPEWQALQWAHRHGVPVTLMDLPMSHRLPLDMQQQLSTTNGPDGPADENDPPTAATDQEPPSAAAEAPRPTWRTDPLALLAEAAGYQDHELWWEEQIERRRDAAGLFEAILEAMRTVRQEVPETRPIDLVREASMRHAIRQALKLGHAEIAVICGAWHAPVLDEAAVRGTLSGCTIKEDRERLKGLPKVKTWATWIPWTYARLTYRSGYGAGVHSPGWYDHLWRSPESAPMRWIASAARLLRQHGLNASSASVIEAVRLSDALAAIRDLRSPGLAELNEAILTVLCHGEPAPLALIRHQLEIGTALGEVPDESPTVPLARDLAEWQKRLRLKPAAAVKFIDLDLRKENDRAKSQLLHRLAVLGVPWGVFQASGGRDSTFHELWELCWKPEFSVAIIEANVWGNTVEGAATAKVIDLAQTAALVDVADLLHRALLANIAQAIPTLLQTIQDRSAVSSDVRTLMDTFLPLARVARYGDVRGTQAGQVEPILIGLFERIAVGLLPGCAALDDNSAEQMLECIGKVQQGLEVWSRDDLRAEWRHKLRQLMHSPVHGLLRGWGARLLLEQQLLTEEELLRETRLALSPAEKRETAAAWINGLLRGSGLLLLHQDGFWRAFDDWMAGLAPETFVEVLPLLRRAFADFSGAERRQMGEKVRRIAESVPKPDSSRGMPERQSPEIAVHHERARKVLPVLRQILGVASDGPESLATNS